jgi:hypothetical protein
MSRPMKDSDMLIALGLGALVLVLAHVSGELTELGANARKIAERLGPAPSLPPSQQPPPATPWGWTTPVPPPPPR